MNRGQDPGSLLLAMAAAGALWWVAGKLWVVITHHWPWLA